MAVRESVSALHLKLAEGEKKQIKGGWGVGDQSELDFSLKTCPCVNIIIVAFKSCSYL